MRASAHACTCARERERERISSLFPSLLGRSFLHSILGLGRMQVIRRYHLFFGGSSFKVGDLQ